MAKTMRKKYLKIHIFAGNILMPRFYVGFEIELTLVPLIILPWPWPIFAYIERNSRIRSKGIEGAPNSTRSCTLATCTYKTNVVGVGRPAQRSE